MTTPKTNSLILGSSRSAQGIKPEIINYLICTDKNKIINHSFALGPSSFGPNYYREVTKKLKGDSRNGLFIISVSPWTLATGVDNIEDDSTEFFEVKEKLFVGNLKSSSTNPNLEYLIHYWDNKFSAFENIFKSAINYKGMIKLHKDGWLEINIDMDTASNNARIKRSKKEYEAKEVKLSPTRFFYLEKIINYLQNYGDVVLVRMPVTTDMKELEHDRFREFDDMVLKTKNKFNIPYFNFIEESGNFLTTDIHHLYKDESEKFTHILCDSINKYLNIPDNGDIGEFASQKHH